MTKKERYAYRVRNGLCVQCGKPTDGLVRCPDCAEKQRRYNAKYMRNEDSHQRKNAQHRAYCKGQYQMMKAQGLCRCGKPLAIGYAKCPECIERDNEYKNKKRMENREAYNTYMREYRKDLRKRRKEKGLCVRCGKPKGNSPYLECTECRNKQLKKRKAGKIPRSEWKDYGMCYHCGKPVMPPYRVCKECYERDMKLLKKANASPLAAQAKREWEDRFYRQMVAARLKKEMK